VASDQWQNQAFIGQITDHNVAGIVGDPLLQMVVNIGRAGALNRPSRRYPFAALGLNVTSELNVTSNFGRWSTAG